MKIIDELNRINKDIIPSAWACSEWLNGEMFIILDQNGDAEIGPWRIHYDYDVGMRIVD